MTASRADRAPVPPLTQALVPALILALALLAGAAPARAQDATPGTGAEADAGTGPAVAPGPMRLVPRELAPPPELEPESAPARTFPGVSPTLGAPVQVDTLEGVDPDSAGVLTPAEGGLPSDMWAGTSRPLARRLLLRLPVTASSQAMRDLMHRLLLSVAAAPEGDGEPGDLAAVRVGLLADMGELVGVETLLGAVPARRGNDALERMEAEVRLLSGDHARACALAGGRMATQEAIGDVFWNKLFIFCQALAGQPDEAALGIALLRELGTEDPVFFSLIEAITAETQPDIQSLSDPQPLHLAAARIAGATLPGDVIASNRPAVLRAIATSPNVPVGIRLEAAERAESAGALPTDVLRQLYMSVDFTDEELASAVSIADNQRGPRSRALLYRAALAQTVPVGRAEAAALALNLGREGGRFGSTASAFVDILREIPPSAELDWFAADAVRALLVAGDSASAEAWLDVLRQRAGFDAAAALRLNGLMPLLRLAGAEAADGWSVEGLADWWETVKEDETAADRAAVLYSLFEARGEPVPEYLWTPLLAAADRAPVVLPHAAIWHRLGDAAGAGRLAETVVLALIALGDGGPAQADPLILEKVLGALGAIGLTNDARAMSVEAALAAGL
jgi:hypothetical protein